MKKTEFTTVRATFSPEHTRREHAVFAIHETYTDEDNTEHCALHVTAFGSDAEGLVEGEAFGALRFEDGTEQYACYGSQVLY